MNPLILIDLASKVFDKVFPDPAKANEAKLELLKLQQSGDLAALDAELKLSLGQIDINKEEAKTDLFRGGWRPLIGYVFGFALAFQYLLNPILLWINAAFNIGITPPDVKLDDTLWELMFGMLGLGGLRTFERVKGKA